jgi:molecular chaperone HscB
VASGQPIPLRPVTSDGSNTVETVECRTCGAGAPTDDHFCPSCSRILTLGRHGDYFSFFGLPRRLQLDAQDLERRFRDMSRKFHPDFFYNAAPAERLASLERSSYLNDAYRALRDPVARIEHLLAVEGLTSPKAHPSTGSGQASFAKVPPSLLEEVFELNEELDAIREAREAGADADVLRARLDAARQPIEEKRVAHARNLDALMVKWDAAPERATLEGLRDLLLERNYINNLLATIEREGSGLLAPGAGKNPESVPGASSPKAGASHG